LEVWRDNTYISRHTSLIEAGESASRHADDYGSGDYYITIGGPPESFTQIMADGLPHNVQAGKVYYMARADVTIRFSESAPVNAYPIGAQASAASSAVSALSGANDIVANITGTGITGSPGAVFASVPAVGGIFSELVGYGANTTGGKNGTVVTVTNLNDTGPGSLRDALDNRPGGPIWIVFTEGLTGTMSIGARLNVDSNTTIDGRGADITIDGGGTDQLYISSGDTNIILMYLKISNADNDNVGCDGDVGNNNYWMHHLTCGPAVDGTIDYTSGVTDITMSYCWHDNRVSGEQKGTLIGGSNGFPNDEMFTTFHHNYWNTAQRQPRTRTCRLHAYNNYHRGWNTNAAAMIGDSGQCYFENNIGDAGFSSGSTVVDWRAGDPVPGKVKSVGTHLLLNGASVTERDPSGVFNPYADYSVTPETADTTLRQKIFDEAGWQLVAHPGYTAPWDN